MKSEEEQAGRAQEDQREQHNELVDEVNRLADAVGVLHQRSESEIHKSIIKDLYGQANIQVRAIIGVGYVGLITTWRAVRPELGDTLFRWVGILSLGSAAAFVTHEVIKVIVTQNHYRRVGKAIEAAGVVLQASDVRTLFKRIESRLFRIWAVMLWLMIVPAIAATILLFYGLVASLVS